MPAQFIRMSIWKGVLGRVKWFLAVETIYGAERVGSERSAWTLCTLTLCREESWAQRWEVGSAEEGDV